MNVAVSVDARFHRIPDGSVWTEAAFDYGFWKRYLDVFEGVNVVARVDCVEAGSAEWKRVDGPGVSVCPLPCYLGPWQYLKHSGRVRQAARQAVAADDAVILRIPSQVSTAVARVLSERGHPYGAEVVADPYEVFRVSSHPLRLFFRWWFTSRMQQQCRDAVALAYVTEGTLQARYPPAGMNVAVSDAELSGNAMAECPRVFEPKENFVLITVGSLAQMYKGTDTLIEALRRCTEWGMDLHLRVLGDGMYRQPLESLAGRLGVSGRVRFYGNVSAGSSVRAHLDEADLFVLPSRSEGLPRAMVEAMARALPCLGSTAGGIPELLAKEDLVPADDPEALAASIRAVVSSAARMTTMSARNLEKARTYREEVLRPKRLEFFRCVRERTERWIEGR